mgnify:FL=1
MLQGALPKRKLSIRIDAQERTDVPYQVKINHVKHGPDSLAMRPAP